MKKIIIIGAGGHAKVLIDALLADKKHVYALTDADNSLKGSKVFGIPVIGTDEKILSYDKNDVLLVNGLGSTHDTSLRKNIYNYWIAKAYHFKTVIHPSASISSLASLASGVQVLANAVINAGANISENCIVNSAAVIEHDCQISKHVHIAPNATVLGNVKIGAKSHIGAGATILQNLTVGEHCLVGAGAVVVKSVATGQKALGVPARSS